MKKRSGIESSRSVTEIFSIASEPIWEPSMSGVEWSWKKEENLKNSFGHWNKKKKQIDEEGKKRSKEGREGKEEWMRKKKKEKKEFQSSSHPTWVFRAWTMLSKWFLRLMRERIQVNWTRSVDFWRRLRRDESQRRSECHMTMRVWRT